ncbi:MAG: hypothetical protein KatS3mg108_3767 [Isosphaeraceae bacterium]|jgi:hypothetical protein|nr:MAG: hypothetical protein KatS3mg108_3767 [Isosphaeraceae bacterium]
MMTRPSVMGLILALGVVAAGQELAYERPPIDYLKAEAEDPVARLQERLDRGEVELKREAGLGYLRSVLEHLGVPVESQGLVFSRTSFQRDRIRPESPRAIYFGDDVYVGYVPGGEVIELAAVDPRLGAVFYVLEQSGEKEPRFERQTHECLSCHAGVRTQDVPGVLVRSVFTDRRGNPIYNAGGFTTDDRSPFDERWGGWYVTGTHGAMRHLGNVFAASEQPESLDREGGANRTELPEAVRVEAYPVAASDIVALMVLEHQTQTHNALARAHQEALIALDYQAGIARALGEPEGVLLESTRRRLDAAAERVVRALLFAGAAPLTDRVRGTTAFAERFSARGIRDEQGRSFRDLDLERRLFRYPCSYLVETEAFDRLPAAVRERVAARLDEILSGRDRSPDYAHLTAEDRGTIRAMLMAIKPGLTQGWSRGEPGG